MRNDNYWLVPVFFLGILVIIFLLYAGSNIENSRIYNKCLNTNQELSHKEAVKLCTEFTK